MPQEFHVLCCYQCGVYQVHQVKKVNKWNCKMCGEKQSIKKVHFTGKGADCRLTVQRLNFVKGQRNENIDAEQQPNSYESEHPTENSTHDYLVTSGEPLQNIDAEQQPNSYESEHPTENSTHDYLVTSGEPLQEVNKWERYVEVNSEVIGDAEPENSPQFANYTWQRKSNGRKRKTYEANTTAIATEKITRVSNLCTEENVLPRPNNYPFKLQNALSEAKKSQNTLFQENAKDVKQDGYNKWSRFSEEMPLDSFVEKSTEQVDAKIEGAPSVHVTKFHPTQLHSSLFVMKPETKVEGSFHKTIKNNENSYKEISVASLSAKWSKYVQEDDCEEEINDDY